MSISAYIERAARAHFPHEGAHGWDHIERVRELALEIAKAEAADVDIVEAAALLHDIGRNAPNESSDGHATVSARLAGPILEACDFDAAKRQTVITAISDHSYSTGRVPESLEGRVLQDADRLDASGAPGIARAFMRAGESGGSMASAVAHFHDKLLRLREGMHTPTARRIAEQRHATLMRFLEDLGSDGRA